jgi:AAA+ ATPase superfamily predicted ATPase
VFTAEPQQVDARILELIDTMQRFRTSDIKMEQEIYACMLHSLFDEYRFLHKYPTQYLEKIAKLFGAIIKNRIMDNTLQEIALKFVLEAYRRDGKRLRFGISVIRHIIDMLPHFPQFFDSIYEHRNQISHSSDPQLLKEIEELYERTMSKSSARTRAPSTFQEDLARPDHRSTVSSLSDESIETSAEPQYMMSGRLTGKDKAPI